MKATYGDVFGTSWDTEWALSSLSPDVKPSEVTFETPPN